MQEGISLIYTVNIGLTTKKYLYAQSSGDWSCTPNTDYTNYANRQININGPLTIYETWGSCEPCSSNGETFGCTDPANLIIIIKMLLLKMVHVHIRQQL